MLYVYKVFVSITGGRPGVVRYVVQEDETNLTLCETPQDLGAELAVRLAESSQDRLTVAMHGPEVPVMSTIRANWTDHFVGLYSIVSRNLFRADIVCLWHMIQPLSADDVRMAADMMRGDRSLYYAWFTAIDYDMVAVATRTNYYAKARVSMLPYNGRYGSGYTLDYHGTTKGCHTREYWIKPIED